MLHTQHGEPLWLMYTCTGPDVNEIPASARMNRAPIFIVDAPRSGTTRLRNMLNWRPRRAICGEARFYHYIYAWHTVHSATWVTGRTRARSAWVPSE